MLPISMCMIVKNEEQRLRRCLESLKGYELELVIVDTGSDDGTKKTAESFGAKVYDFAWCDDFSMARNFSLEKASNDWILMMDSDEWVEQLDVEELEYFMSHLQRAVGSVTRRNQVTTPMGIEYTNDQTERFFNRIYYYYTGRIHEQLTPRPGMEMECFLLNTSILHDGYDMTPEQREKKAERNLRLLEQEIREHGETPYLLYQMGKGYEIIEDYRTACSYFEHAMQYELDESLAYMQEMKRTYADDLHRIALEMEGKSLIVFTATHVKFHPPENPVYVPLHVGREGKEDLGYLGDNVGEHISDLNFLYGELTGLYWIWQNIHELDYVGLCHYRRYFLNEQHVEMGRRDYLSLLGRYDVILPRHAICEGSYREHYGRAHNIHDLEAVGRAIGRVCPEYTEYFEKAMRETVFYSGNLMVTSKAILDGYAKWLFEVFLEASEDIDVSSYDNYHKRVYGFLSEQMMYIYVMKHGLRYCEVPVGISEEKAETKELKEKLTQCMRQRNVHEALRIFELVLKERPDVLLAGSDIHSELKMMYQILHLCEVEERQGKTSLLDYSTEAQILMKHYRRILDILHKKVNQKQEPEDITYLENTGVSDEVMNEIIRCTPSLQKS